MLRSNPAPSIFCNLTAMLPFAQPKVRVFLDQGSGQRFDGINGDSNDPLSADYVANLATFINDAAEAGIYTMVTLSSIPVNAYFDNITSSVAPNIQTTNRYAFPYSTQSSRRALSSPLRTHLHPPPPPLDTCTLVTSVIML